jgi:hypothetical protein
MLELLYKTKAKFVFAAELFLTFMILMSATAFFILEQIKIPPVLVEIFGWSKLETKVSDFITLAKSTQTILRLFTGCCLVVFVFQVISVVTAVCLTRQIKFTLKR